MGYSGWKNNARNVDYMDALVRPPLDVSKTPCVSVVIPTYRRAHMIGRAIRSVLAQTFQDWELLVVNDGPEDGTEAVVRSFQDPRVRYLEHETNRGASAARNTGIHAARGEYVAFLDSDDEWMPRKLEKQVAILSSDDALAFVSCGCTLVADDGTLAELVPPQALFTQQQLIRLECLFVMTTGVLVCRRTALLAAGGFDESLPPLEDCDLCIRLSARPGMACIQEPLLRVHHSSTWERIGADVNGVVRGIEQVIEKHALKFNADKVALANWLIYAGDRCFRGDRLRQGRSFYRRAWNAAHLPGNRRVHLLLSYCPPLYTLIYKLWRGIYWGLRHPTGDGYRSS